jgi:uncharacterized protein (TIGR02217 family)
MAFHEVRFPDDISRGARGGPERRTQIVELSSGVEERNASWSDSRRRFDVAYGVRRADDLSAVVSFFEARNGRLYGFRFKDWADYKSCRPSQTPSASDQLVGLGDAAQTEFQLQKLYTSGPQSWARAVEKPVAGSVLVALDSVEQASGWTIDATTGLIRFDVAPPAGIAVMAGYEFDVPVRFDSDALDVTLSFERLGSITTIALVEIRKRASPVIITPPVEPPVEPGLPAFLWADVFADHRLTPPFGDNAAGEDWTGWGDSSSQSAEVPLEWFLQNVLPNDAPTGAIVDLDSPNGELHLKGRMQPPPGSRANNITLDLSGNVIERGEGDDYWGQVFLWGEKVNDPAMTSEAVIGADSVAGEYVLYLKDPDPDTEALLSAAVPGSIIEIRTNTTRKSYHPEESRTTCFVASTDPVNKTITVQDPLEIDVPKDNPIGSWESSDPSTVTLLQGSLLQNNAAAGSGTIAMANALGLAAGDWLVVGTAELPGHLNNQFMDFQVDPNQIGPDLDIMFPADYGGTLIAINEELHQIAAITGNTVTLVGTLGKNKLVAWQAFAFKVDPVQDFTLIGGSFVGAKAHGSAAAWDHQYVWCRFMVNSLIRDCAFDTDEAKGTTLRRTGQAVRFDTGDGNVMDNLTIGRPGSIDAGEGYGVSFRKGERNSVIRNSFLEGCRHSIEFWSSSGGCVAEDNHCADDTSSSIDTHGNWNTGIIIRRNLLTRDRNSAAVSPDLDPNEATDAIRIGNNKFIFDENIQVLDNTVTNYDGNALSIVPGAWDVTVDGLTIDGCWRILNMKQNSRHSDLFMRDIVIRNVNAINIRDRWLDIRHNSHNGSRMQAKGLLLKDWIIGATGPTAVPADGNPIAGVDDITGMYFLHVDGLTLQNWTITNANLTNDNWLMVFDEINDVTLSNVTIDCLASGEADKGINFNNATNIRGGITLTGLLPPQGGGDPFLVYFNDGTGTPSSTDTGVTISHDLGASPKVLGGPPPDFSLTLAQV